MTQNRVRIVDVADALGLSTATVSKVVNLVIDHYNGGYQAGKYLKELGHKKALCIADNFICMDKERIEGFRKAFEQGETYRWEIPKTEKERTFGFQRISRSSALMITWQAGKAILPSQRFIRKQA